MRESRRGPAVSSDETYVRLVSEHLESAARVLRGCVAAIDEMWNQAGGRAELSDWAMTLGEASHVMHRALITLDLPLQAGGRSE
jgi:hypothetical protein